jgi:hypothetical protein
MVATMAKQPRDAKPAKKSLNVGIEDGERIAKVAAHRGLTIEELFAAKDVREFFIHLLVEEMRQESERLKGKK